MMSASFRLGTRAALACLVASVTLSASAQATELNVARPRDFVTGGPKGGAIAPGRARYKLRNRGTTAAEWSVSTDAPWLTMIPDSGNLAPGASVNVLAWVDQSMAGTFLLGQRSGEIVFVDDSSSEEIARVDAEMHIGFTIDEDEHFRLYGQPFVPIGVWAQPPEDAWGAYHADLGMNVLVGNGYAGASLNGQFLDVARDHGMLGMLNYDGNVKDHPALLGWYLYDEPDLHSTPPAQVLAQYNSWKAQDPEHEIMMNLTGFFYGDASWPTNADESLYFDYTAIPDWVAFDFYPVTGYNRPELAYVPGAATEMMADYFLDHRAPVWTWIEASDQNLSWVPASTPGPTAAQMRFEIWDSIVRGAKAIGYFTISFEPWSWSFLTPEVEAELRRTNRDIERLTPLITAPDANVNLTVTELSDQDVNYMVKRRGRSVFVFVTNADMHQPYRSASMDFTFDQAPSRVDVYGENRSIIPSGNGFSDTFEPLAARIYIVRF